MKYWIDEDSSHKNVIVFTASAIILGSVDKQAIKNVASQLAAKTNPTEVLGSEDLLTIPFVQIQSIESRNTDDSIDIRYKAKKDIEDESLSFFNHQQKQEAIKTLNIILPDHLEKKVYDQSAFAAVISPSLSLLVSIYASYLFINKFRWLSIILGGFWVLASLYMLYDRFTNPPRITRWNIKAKYARKAWQGIKTGFAYIILAAIISNVHSRFADSYGVSSLYQQIQEGEWQEESVEYYVGHGADVNYRDEDGDSLVWLAVSYEDTELLKQLLASAADPTIQSDNNDSPLALSVSYQNQDIIQLLLNSGAKFKDLNQVFLDSMDYQVNQKLLELMLKQGADINYQSEDGDTPLSKIVSNSDDSEMAQFLIKHGAKIDILIEEMDLLQFAVQNEKGQLVELLTPYFENLAEQAE